MVRYLMQLHDATGVTVDAPRKVLDLWKDGALVLAWLPSWLPWLVAAALLFVPGILILFAPPIDRRTASAHRRPGMRELLKYD